MNELKVQSRDYGNIIDFALVDERLTGRMVGRPVEMVELGDELIQQPTFGLNREGTQALVDRLYVLGFVAKDVKKKLERLDDAEQHTESLRRLVAALEPRR